MMNLLIRFTILLPLLLLSGSALLQAQTNFIYGLKAGANISQFVDIPNSYEPTFGFTAGGSVDVTFSGRKYGLESGIYYSQVRTTRQIDGINTEFGIDYITLPLYAKYYFTLPELTGTYIIAGSGVSFMQSSDVDFKAGDLGDRDIKDQTNSMQYSAIGGFGTNFYLHNLHMTLRAQYSISLNDVFIGDEMFGGRNSIVTVMAGIYF